MTVSQYQTYRNLPPLAGLCTHEQAAQPGLLVAECVRRHKALHYSLKRLHEIFTTRITSEPIYELKTGFSHHAYLCAEHITAIRNRVAEMREPPLGLEVVPNDALEIFFDEIRNARTTEELLVGLYGVAIPAVKQAAEAYFLETNPLTDAPSRRVLRFLLLELDDMLRFGEQALEKMFCVRQGEWEQNLHAILHNLGGIAGNETAVAAKRISSEKPYVYDRIPQRDERFSDVWNQGVNAEAFLYDANFPASAKILMMYFKRIREIDVPEMMASILAETSGKPWEYYYKMSRQIWDEARHAMMGEVGFVALGIDWTRAKITWNWSYRLNTECSPLERHGVLFFIEQGLMPRTGKRYEFEVAQQSENPLAATIQDFDWADEVLHSQIGREWYVPQFENLQAALDFGDRAWSKILSNWAEVRERGLTNHENWWPAIYLQACERTSQQPEPAILAYSTTYEGKRADLNAVE